jgi:excisionase family DNA binding protein
MLTCVTAKTRTSIIRKAWSPKEVADTTGLSLGFVRKEIREGCLRAVNAGRRLLITDEELQRYLTEGSRKFN